MNQSRRPEEHILLCVGIGYGDVLRVGDSELWGAEVNAASKLGEDTARSGEVLVTGAVKDALSDATHLTFIDLGSAPPGASNSYRVNSTG